MTYHLSGKELFIRFTARAFRKLLSIYVFSYFPIGFEGKMWDLIVSVPDHCFSFFLVLIQFLVLILFLVLIQLKPLSNLLLTVPRRCLCCSLF